MRRPNTPKRRVAFTLVELLVVIVILGVLIGLLLPAIQAAVRTAREAAISAEIQTLVQALADFKNQYGEYPPSRVVLVESGDYRIANLGGAGTPLAALQPRSLAALRKYWPRMTISTTTAPPTTGYLGLPQGFYDFNGNGIADAPYVLTGPDCLVFFLGGAVQAVPGVGWTVTGWSKNPLNPFINPSSTGVAGASNRQPPLFEFRNDRLVTNPNNTVAPTGGWPGYVHTQGIGPDAANPSFYVYFSAYNGVGYDPGDYDGNEPDDAGTTTSIVGAFMTNNAATNTPVFATRPDLVASPSPNPYTNSCPVPTLATGHVDTSTTDGIGNRPRAWQNANSFQIVSPGIDGLYGIGGQFNTKSPSGALPFIQATGSTYTADTYQTQEANTDFTGGTALSSGIRLRENDNVTNFSQGRLQ
jgi:general secretion pathway protein G